MIMMISNKSTMMLCLTFLAGAKATSNKTDQFKINDRVLVYRDDDPNVCDMYYKGTITKIDDGEYFKVEFDDSNVSDQRYRRDQMTLLKESEPDVSENFCAKADSHNEHVLTEPRFNDQKRTCKPVKAARQNNRLLHSAKMKVSRKFEVDDKVGYIAGKDGYVHGKVTQVIRSGPEFLYLVQREQVWKNKFYKPELLRADQLKPAVFKRQDDVRGKFVLKDDDAENDSSEPEMGFVEGHILAITHMKDFSGENMYWVIDEDQVHVHGVRFEDLILLNRDTENDSYQANDRVTGIQVVLGDPDTKSKPRIFKGIVKSVNDDDDQPYCVVGQIEGEKKTGSYWFSADELLLSQ